jgi:hypothetical protein
LVGLTFLAGFVIGLTQSPSASPTQMLVLIGLSNIICVTLGFIIVAVRTNRQRLKHLAIVAFILWIISAFNLLMAEIVLAQWLIALPLLMILMLIGFGISCLIKPQQTDNS